MRWLFGAFLALSSFMASPASAGQWRMVAGTTEVGFYFDQSTVKGDKIKTVWTEMAYAKTSEAGFDLVLRMVEFNCEERSSADLFIAAYKADGTSIYSKGGRRPSNFIIPDTSEEYLLKAVCFNEYVIDVPLVFNSAYDALGNWRKSRELSSTVEPH